MPRPRSIARRAPDAPGRRARAVTFRYGMDAPGVVAALLAAAAADVALFVWRGWSLGPAVGCGATGLAMLWSSAVGKLRQRETLVDAVALRGDAAREGVAARVAVESADMRALPFADASFDVVLSSLAIHNVAGAADRARAVREIARVLRPGGRVAIQDIARTAEYARELAAGGLRDVRRSRWRFAVIPPVRLVSAVK